MDFNPYDSRKSFSLEEVARYWCETEASIKTLPPDMLNRVQSRFRELEDAVVSGALKVVAVVSGALKVVAARDPSRRRRKLRNGQAIPRTRKD